MEPERLGIHAGLTQRAIHKLEQGEADPRRATVRAIEAVWREQGIEFEDLADAGFRVSVHSALLDRLHSAPRVDFGVTANVRRTPRHRG